MAYHHRTNYKTNHRTTIEVGTGKTSKVSQAIGGISPIYTVKTGTITQSYRVKNNFVLINDLFVEVFKHVADLNIYTCLCITARSIRTKLDAALDRYNFLLRYTIPSGLSTYYNMVAHYRRTTSDVGYWNRNYTFSILANGIRHGPFTIWYTSGQVERIGIYDEGKLRGVVTNYRKNSLISSIEHFVMGVRVSVVRYDVNGNVRDQ